MIAWKRGDLPLMTLHMMEILQQLRAADESGFPFVTMKLHYKTSDGLIDRDWVVRSIGINGDEAWKITGRGLDALRVYERPGPRRDGICPDCGIKPKQVSRNGTVYGYCHDCNQKHYKRQFALKGNQLKPEGLCARCKKRPRHIYPSGFVIVYCKKCLRVHRKAERRRKHQQLFKRIANGELILCIRCKTEPRYHTRKVVYDYCHACYRELQNDYCRRKKAEQGK